MGGQLKGRCRHSFRVYGPRGLIAIEHKELASKLQVLFSQFPNFDSNCVCKEQQFLFPRACLFVWYRYHWILLWEEIQRLGYFVGIDKYEKRESYLRSHDTSTFRVSTPRNLKKRVTTRAKATATEEALRWFVDEKINTNNKRLLEIQKLACEMACGGPRASKCRLYQHKLQRIKKRRKNFCNR